MKNKLRNLIKAIQIFWYDVTGKSIYGIWFSIDCDMCESYTPARFNNRKALERAHEEKSEWAEGPFGFNECSKEECDSFEPHQRDRVMEAYENGNGKSIYV